MKRYYTYEIKNLINGKYYRGVHSDNGEEDYYMGSGKLLWQSYRYRLNNPNLNPRNSAHRKLVFNSGIYSKTILKVFDTLEEAYKHEEEIVTLADVESPMCYNIAIGGCGGSKAQADSNRENHGGICAFNMQDSIEKSLETRILRYGSTTAQCNSDESVQKRTSTMKERYGDSLSFLNNQESKAKREATNVEKYGSVMGACLTEEAIRKNRESAAKRYDGDPFGMIHTKECIEKRGKILGKKWKFIRPDGSEYITTKAGATKISKRLGETWEGPFEIEQRD